MIEKKKVLVVDDEVEALFYLGKILERHNFAVVSTSKGKEASMLAKQENPDLIILDISMPDMDGGDILSELDKDRMTRDIPVVFLTALVNKDEAIGKTVGKRHIPIVAKPVDETELLRVIKKNMYS